MVPVVDHTLLVAALTGQAFISSDIDRRIWLSSLIEESVEIMVGARDGGKGIVKGLFDVDRRIPVRGLFFDIQTFRVHAFRQDRSMLRCIHAS